MALYVVKMLCESLYLLWYKGQPALWITNGCTSELNPIAILSTPMSVDNKVTSEFFNYLFQMVSFSPSVKICAVGKLLGFTDEAFVL